MHTQLVTPNTFVDSSSPQKNKSRGSKGSNNKSSPPRNRNYSKTAENNTMKTPTKASQRMVNHQSDYILNSDVNTSNNNNKHQYNNNTHQQLPFPFSEKSLKMLQKETDQIPTKEAVSNILELLTRKDNLVKLSEYASPQQHAPITIDSPLNVSSSYSYVNAPVTPTKSEKIVRPLSPPTRDSNRPRRNSANQNNNLLAPSMMSNNNTVAAVNNNNNINTDSPVSRWAGSISAPAPSQLPKPVFFSSPKSDHAVASSNNTASPIAESSPSYQPQPQSLPIHKSSAARQLQFNSIPVNTTVPAPQMTPMPFPFPPIAAHYAPEQQHAMLHPTVQHMMAHVAASATVANNNQDLGQLSNQLKMMLNIAPSSVRS
jgi:hypothetical protein